MKLVLFICISLFASLLHAAAMPIADISDTPMTHEVEMVGHHSPEQHASMTVSDHHDRANHCPDNDYTCCLAMALRPDPIMPIAFVFSEESYASLSLNRPNLRPEVLYRPPKFHPFLAT